MSSARPPAQAEGPSALQKPKQRGRVRILDGGLGTTLEDSYGIHFSSAATPLWSSHLLVSAAQQQTLLACQRSFSDAGADILLTATYQVSIEGFARTRTAEYPEGIPRNAVPGFLRDAVRIAREAAAGHGQRKDAGIALSLGPYGACMVPTSAEYSGVYDAEHDGEWPLMKWHRERLELFVDAGLVEEVDLVAFETVPRVDEIRAIRRMLASGQLIGKKPFWISCVYPGDDACLPDGTGIRDVVQAMLSPNLSDAVPWAIGINCTKVGKLDGLIREYEAAVLEFLGPAARSTFPTLVVYPDGTNGEVYDQTTQSWVRSAGNDDAVRSQPAIADGRDILLTVRKVPWAARLSNIVLSTSDRGIWNGLLVGGCCKTTPNTIRDLRDAIMRTSVSHLDANPSDG